MARYFEVKRDTSIPRAFRVVRDQHGNPIDYETEGIAYNAGGVTSDEYVDPRVIERFDDGDEHLRSILEEVDEDRARELSAELFEPRAPEHTVEAYALAQEGKPLLTRDDVLEAQSAGAEDAQKAQAEAKKSGGDEVSAETDERPGIDAAAAKGAGDRKAGRSRKVSEAAKEDTGSSKKSSSSSSSSSSSDENKSSGSSDSGSSQGDGKSE